MARLQRGTRRLPWLGPWRITPDELLEATGALADPPRRPHGPHLGLLSGPLADRHTTRIPAPPRRIRPPDLEAEASGIALYGERASVPWPYADRSVLGVQPADAVGVVATYTAADFVSAARVRVRVARSATAGALVVTVTLTRAGRAFLLWTLANADLETAAPVTLLPNDQLTVAVATAGTAGLTVTAALSIEERP